MKFLLNTLFMSALLFGASVDKKISNTSSELNKYSQNYSKINEKMSQNAKEILKQKKELEEQNSYLKALKEDLATKELKYKENVSQLKELKVSQKSLQTQRDTIEEDLVFVIAQSISLSLILNEDYSSSQESIIEFEVLQGMLKTSKQKADALGKEFLEASKEVKKLNELVKHLEDAIASIETKRKDVVRTQNANIKALAKLEKNKDLYKNELQKLLKKQDTLKQTLAQLNIIKIDQIRKAKEEKSRKEAFAKKTFVTEKEIQVDKGTTSVKKVGSSYQEVRTANYTGAKTIAPLDSYTITKKYGTYVDPIYKIKIFNESISMRPKNRNAKVKTVFNGKVIYADKTAVLNNIVIVEHINGLHTIYANLSQIAPDIKKGKKIKQGYTIGRVEDELIFEVTQKSLHINPIRLFQ